MELIIANPRGFCAGVIRAIEIIERAIKKFPPPIYVHHEIVHNKRIVEDLKNRGVIFVDDVDLVPEGAALILSAHGASKAVEEAAREKSILIDATCPLVKKVHNQVLRYADSERNIVIVGHRSHPEVIGTIGQTERSMFIVENCDDVYALPLQCTDPIAYVTQTTLSVDDTAGIIRALHDRFLDVEGPSLSDICYATQNRQKAVKNLLDSVTMLIVVGSANSSNSNRLRDIGDGIGIPSYLVDDIDMIDWRWFSGHKKIGLTAGASAPEVLIEEIISAIRGKFGDIKVRELEGKSENIVFKLPDILVGV